VGSFRQGARFNRTEETELASDKENRLLALRHGFCFADCRTLPPQMLNVWTMVHSIPAQSYVILGDCLVAKSLQQALSAILGPDAITIASDENAAEVMLWEAGDDQLRYDTTHLIHVSPAARPLSPDVLFRTHCRFRPSDRRPAALIGFGPGWAGAIIFVGLVARNMNELAELPPFSRIPGSHYVEPVPVSLCRLLQKITTVTPLYGEKWKQQLTAIEGLANFRQALEFAENTGNEPADALRKIRTVIDAVLRDKLLNKLWTHREVFGELRKVRNTLGTAKEFSAFDLSEATKSIRSILRDYL